MKHFFLLFVLLFVMSSCSQYPDTPPEGWSIVSNGKEYAFVFPNGTVSQYPKGSYSDAVRSAWEQYEYGKKRDDQKTWPTVTK